MNKHAETKLATILIWILVIGAIAYVADFGGFKGTVNGLLGTGQVASTQYTPSQGGIIAGNAVDCPTDGTTTYSINVQDALATTATSLYPEYYVFNGNQLIKEGTLSASANTISVSCGKDYQVLLVNTTTTAAAGDTSGVYAKTIDLQARIAEQTVNVAMTRTGTAKVYKLINPLEGASSDAYNNMTLAASTTKAWQIQFGANQTARGYNNPIIVCDVNTTEILSLGLTSFDDGKTPVVVSAPKRLSTSSVGRMLYAWEYPGMLDTTKIIVGSGQITSTVTGPVAAFTSNMTCKMVDQQTWKTAAYKTASSVSQGFIEGPENANTLAEVGGPDTSSVTLGFLNANGL